MWRAGALAEVLTGRGACEDAQPLAGDASLGSLAATKMIARVLSGAQLQENAHTLAGAAGLGPSLVR